MKGNPVKSSKGFTRYTGNVKSSSDSFPKNTSKTPAGGKTSSNLKKTGVAKKLGSRG